MNGRKSKRIRAHSSTIFVEWFKTLVSEEEGKKINTKNYTNYMPEQTHFMAHRTMHRNAYHPKWIGNKILRVLKANPKREIESITLGEIH